MSSRSGGVGWRALAGVAIRPNLWPIAVVVARRLAAPGWWKQWPPVPMPSADYERFRLQVYFGGDGRLPAALGADDVVAYLKWCRWMTSLR